MRTWGDKGKQVWKVFLIITVCVGNLLYTINTGHTAPCEPWAANSDTYNTTLSVTGKDQFWIAYRSFSGFPPTMYVDGLIFFQPGFFSVPGPITEVGVQYFDQRILVVVRGFDQKIWVNSWNGSGWTGWASAPTPLFDNQPPGFAAKNSAGVGTPNGVLVVSAKSIDGKIYHIRSTALINGFADGWRLLGVSQITSSSIRVCADPSQIRLGGEGSDNNCRRRRSTDGINWTTTDEVLPACPMP
jgi:hypothetical protein